MTFQKLNDNWHKIQTAQHNFAALFYGSKTQTINKRDAKKWKRKKWGFLGPNNTGLRKKL
jgi:hypothetical protein